MLNAKIGSRDVIASGTIVYDRKLGPLMMELPSGDWIAVKVEDGELSAEWTGSTRELILTGMEGVNSAVTLDSIFTINAKKNGVTLSISGGQNDIFTVHYTLFA